jgi:serine O-acetyltransferase
MSRPNSPPEPSGRPSDPEPARGPDQVADALLDGYLQPDAPMQHIGSYELPSTEQVARVLEQCRALLFPGFVGPSVARLPRTELRILIRERIDEVKNGLRRQVYRGLHHITQRNKGTNEPDCDECWVLADDITTRFVARLPELRQQVGLDVRAAYEGDPAASDLDEILFCYPGTYAISVYRIAHALLREGAVLVPRIMTEIAHEKTGIDIHPGATVGASFFIDHGTGVVIGETTLIGDRVRLYQGVTLGALTVPQGAERPRPGAKRHPTLEDDVVIYANATILGGDTVIGKGAVVGGNSWVTASVPPGAVVAGTHSRRSTLAATP